MSATETQPETSKTPDAPDPLPAVSRLRLAAGCALLVGLAFVQDPGFLVPDTKFDLVAAPAEFLARAVHLWDAEGAFGQVQNQAYGYLWPMGPFFVLGDLLGSPDWAVQRAWQALVLCVAFVGTARLGRALGVRSDAAVLVAAAAYALSPRMLTTLGPISIEAWPSAVAPWVLLPLVLGATRGSPRRAAALSALAIAMVGGVNAAATFAVIPLGAVWVLTRTSGPRRRSLLVWWPAFTALATLWWLVPLVLLGRYSPPFLDFIETGAVTTFPTTLVDTLRGTSNWVPYVDPASRAGNDLLTTGYLAINSGVVLLVGFIGLLDRSNPHRRFLGLGVAVGVLMVTLGHVGSVDGWFATDVRTLLDGVLSPIRNVHKFDPVVRLPLVLGLAWALDRVLAHASTPSGEPRPRLERFAFTAMTVAAVVGASLPAIQARVEPAGAMLAVPDYWSETADYLDAESDGGVALVVPGSSFGSYVWGTPRDEPMQWLAGSRWAVRNVIPLTPPGNIRMLDEVERRLAQGDGSPALTGYLRRAGVEHLVVRNDLAPSSDVPDPAVVHEAIAGSPGIDRVAGFGPEVGGEASLETTGGRLVVNSGRQARYAAVEVFEVGGAPASAATEATVVAGGPEDLLDLTDLDVVGDEPAVLGPDVPDGDLDALPAGRVVLTDGLRDRERQFSRIHDGYGPTRDPGYERRTTNPTADYGIGGTPGDADDGWRTRVRLDGAVALTASSSASDPTNPGGARPGELPAAALDRDPTTAWTSSVGQGGPAWWRLDLDDALPASVTLVGGRAAADNQSVQVVTAAGTSERVRLGPGDRREVALPDGDSTWLRVEDATSVGGRLSVAEVALPGVDVERRLVLPTLPETWGTPDAVVLRAARDARTGCTTVAATVACSAERAVPSEEPTGLRRVVPLVERATYDARLTVLPRAGGPLDRLALTGQAVLAAASSSPVADPRAGPLAALDGDPGTTWVAGVDDEQPTFTVRWFDRRRIDGITLETAPGVAAAAPTRLALSWPGGRTEVDVVDGRASFPPITVKRLRLRVVAAEPVNDLDFDAQSRRVPVGISELAVDGLPYLPLGLSSDPLDLPCGSGPDLLVDGDAVRTRVTASPFQLARGVPVPAEPCGPAAGTGVTLDAGETEVDALGTATFDVASVVLTRAGAGVGTSAGTDVPLTSAGPTERRVEVDGGSRVVTVRENTNPGWVAERAGDDLEPVVVDGWQQGFVLPDDGEAAPVEVTFAPDATYRGGLLAGVLALLVLGAVLLLARRRWAGPDHPPVGPARLPAPVLAVAVVVVAGLVAGWAGVAVAVVAAGAAWALDRWLAEAAPLLLAVPVLVATLPYLVTPWGSPDGWAGDASWPHYLALVPLVSVLVLAWDPRPARDEPRRRLFSRSAGRSTSR